MVGPCLGDIVIRSRPGRRLAGHLPGTPKSAMLLMTSVAVLAVAVNGCGSAHQGGAAGPLQPPVAPGQTTSGPDLSGVALPDFVMPLIQGGVSLPDSKLTPGAVTTTNADAVCNMAGRSTPQISLAMTARVFAEYHENENGPGYILDWLVPYNLGGAPVMANLWPAGLKGTGFYQKGQTDGVLRQLVCRRTLTLAQAQRALETNWYSAWLRYVVATGRV